MSGTARAQPAQKMVRFLATCGTWTGRDELIAAAGCSESRAEDELADLVLTGRALYNQRTREYRLAGSPLARRALQQLLEGGGERRVLARQSADKARFEFGLAVRSTGPEGEERFTMADLDMPYPAGKPAELLLATWAFGADLAAAAGEASA